ncbi:MAG: menaquinone biosynthetic enzyme MqnA/MqnD family protein [Phycisphaerales bacterium JB039]
MKPIRVACVEYLNTVPLIEGLEKLDALTLDRAAPSRIVDMLTGGRADIGLVSLIDAARAPAPLALLPVGMIGCDGPTMTVRIFSRVPLDQIRRLHADTDSHTSTALARLILEKQFGARVEVIDYDAREDIAVGGERADPEAMLLIGDKVVTLAPRLERFGHTVDLGEAWKDLTGLPFVYAVWMCRAGEQDDPAIQAAAAAIDRARRHNMLRLSWIVARRAGELRWPQELAERYIGELLRFEVGPRQRAAARQFLDMCAQAGLAPPAQLRWAELAPPAAASAGAPGGA